MSLLIILNVGVPLLLIVSTMAMAFILLDAPEPAWLGHKVNILTWLQINDCVYYMLMLTGCSLAALYGLV